MQNTLALMLRGATPAAFQQAPFNAAREPRKFSEALPNPALLPRIPSIMPDVRTAPGFEYNDEDEALRAYWLRNYGMAF